MRFRTRTLFALTVALGVAPALVASSMPSARHVFHGAKHAPNAVVRNPDGSPKLDASFSLESYNWSGYALEDFGAGTGYLSATGSWTVPKVSFQEVAQSCNPISAWGFSPQQKCTTPSVSAEYSASWVGIGGTCLNAECTSTDSTLIQTGTGQDVASDGTTFYYAWYELLPATETEIGTPTTNPVSAGDSIKASVSCLSNCTANQQQLWRISIKDLTQNWSFSIEVTYASSLASVEWIEEAPTASGSILALANYGTATFDPTDNGALPGFANSAFGSIGPSAIIMTNSSGAVSAPSAVTQLDVFSTCWGGNPVNFVKCPTP